MNQRASKSILNRGMKKISQSANYATAYNTISIPQGGRLFVILQNEITLNNPLLHLESELKSDKFTYDKKIGKLTCNNKLGYDTLIKYQDLYFTIKKEALYNENTIYHYELYQCDIANLLIFESIDDIDHSLIYDYSSMPYLLTLFDRYKIDIYPRNLMVNRDLLKKKCVFVNVDESYSLSKAFQKPQQRIDRIKFYFNNYSKKELFEIQYTIQKMINLQELALVGYENIFEIKEINSEGYIPSICALCEFEHFYTLDDNIPMDLIHYIKKVAFDIQSLKDKEIENV